MKPRGVNDKQTIKRFEFVDKNGSILIIRQS